MKVTKWINWDDADEYIGLDDITMEDISSIEQAVIEEVKNKGYKFSGSAHQRRENCTPVVDDKYVYAVSMRKWGRIIADAYNLNNDDGLAYVYWAWSTRDGETCVYPEGE